MVERGRREHSKEERERERGRGDGGMELIEGGERRGEGREEHSGGKGWKERKVGIYFV